MIKHLQEQMFNPLPGAVSSKMSAKTFINLTTQCPQKNKEKILY